jgi:hypothetical protein
MRSKVWLSACGLILAVVLLVAPASARAAEQQISVDPWSAWASSTYTGGYEPYYAFDGHLGTMWNAGGFPEAWIAFGLGGSRLLSRVQLHVGQYPDGWTVHDIYTHNGDWNWQHAKRVEGWTSNGQTLDVSFGARWATHVWVVTRSSPSWVGWIEIRAYETVATPPPTGNYILYFHGRLMSGWPPEALLAAVPGWDHIVFNYNGNQRLEHWETRVAIRDAINAYCRGGSQCVAVCYSAGCNRLLMGINDVQNTYGYVDRLLWTHAAGSAAGGTELVNEKLRNKASIFAAIFNFIFSFGVLSPVFLAYSLWTVNWGAVFYSIATMGTDRVDVPAAEAIDKDLLPSTMRYNFGYIQNVMPAPMYHAAGHRNICESIRVLWVFKFKLCTNKYFPGGHGDGAVPMHSSCGYADTGAYGNCCWGGPKYTNRTVENACSYDHNHSSILKPAVERGSLYLSQTKTINPSPMSSWAENLPDCNPLYDDCQGFWGVQEDIVGNMVRPLNVTYAANLISNPKAWCYECDINAVSACRYFSIAMSGYDVGDNFFTCSTCLDACNSARKCCTGLNKYGQVLGQYGIQHCDSCQEVPICDKYGCANRLMRWTCNYKGYCGWDSCCNPTPYWAVRALND